MPSKRSPKKARRVSPPRSDSSNESNSTTHSSGSSSFDDTPTYDDSAKKRKILHASQPEKTDKPQKPTTFPLPNRDDTEFARDDYVGRIKRYREHIAAGYMVDFYKGKIQRLLDNQTSQALIMKQFPGKSWDTIQRMENLKMIKSYLEEKGDPCKELRNVRAVMKAYESGELESDGNATYWGRGKKIAGPSPFSMNDFRKFNTPKNRGSGGFWVEGPFFDVKRKPRTVAYGSNMHQRSGCTELDITLRLDSKILGVETTDNQGVPFPELELRFLDDTGACIMCIYKDDMYALMGNNVTESTAPMEHVMGYSLFTNCDGGKAVNMIIAVEANILGQDTLANPRYVGEQWTCIPTSVFDKSEGEPGGPIDRLGGPFIRSVFYVGHAPERPFANIYAGRTKEDLTAVIPECEPWEICQPHYLMPTAAVGWKYDESDKLWRAYPNYEHRGRVPHDIPPRLI